MHARSRPTLYDQLLTLPEGVIGEILDGSFAPFDATVLHLDALWGPTG